MAILPSAPSSLFTEAPWFYLSWPAVAMLLGTLIGVFAKSSATRLAIVPRQPGSLIGIATAPFVHANFAHFAANLPPFLVLGYLVLQHEAGSFLQNALMIAAAQGILLWSFGRRASHVGMSGVIFGFFGYLLALAYYTRATPDVLVAGGVLLVYGGMLAGIAPTRNGTSWDGHLFGLIAGLSVAWWQFHR